MTAVRGFGSRTAFSMVPAGSLQKNIDLISYGNPEL